MTSSPHLEPFNTPLETGIRSLAILVASFPETMDIQRLIEMDYLVVHSEDLGGPKSLHAALPLRAGELLVRRGIIERGIMLMMSRGLICRIQDDSGFSYQATDEAAPFLSMLSTPYSRKLVSRSNWATSNFKNISTDKIREIINQFFEKWSSEFQSRNPVEEN